MKIVYCWANDNQTILKVDFNGEWNLQACKQALINVEWRICRRQGVIVDVVADFSKSRHIPFSALALVKRVLALLPDNCGIIVFVRLSSTASAIRQTYIRLHPEFAERLLEVKNMHEALYLLHRLKEQTRYGNSGRH